ncbi:MAG: Do family serine endopeptidase [Pyrinomonadaceae bacterium]|nr:Do family serine endopeptidase [Pyrinomonadaceae bacterium]
MLHKFTKQSGANKLSILLLIVLLSAAAGCKSNLFNPPNEATVSPASPPSAPPAPLVVDGVRTSYADVVEKTSPAVVRIEAEVARQQNQQPPLNLEDFFDLPGAPQGQGRGPVPPTQQPPPTQRGVGSGVIVSADGTILTNNHVVEGAQKITVLMNDDRTYEAKVVGLDAPSDLAVLKIEAANLPFLNLGNSDNVRVGDVVLAIGNPLGIGQTVTAGIISAKGRRTGLSDGSFEDFLQTDAPINRGNSGGALVNLTGELIGINSQILSTGGREGGGSIGIGFSIPSNMAKGVMEQLVASGKVRRGMLGVGIQAVNDEIKSLFGLKDTKGVLINDVKKGSAAEKAGVKRDDIIIAINGETIDDTNTLRNKVAGTLPGTEIRLKIVREGQEQEIPVALGELNPESAKNVQPNENNKGAAKPNEGGKLGLNLQPLSPSIAKQLELPEDVGGVVVSDVEPNGAAAKIGIGRGDVILTINRQPVKSLEDVQAALDKSGDKPILLLVARKGQTVYLTVRPS